MDPTRIKTRYTEAEFRALNTVDTFKGVIKDGTILRAGQGHNLLVGHTGPDGKTTLEVVPAIIDQPRKTSRIIEDMMNYSR